jgi:HK97 family phage portal protein
MAFKDLFKKRETPEQRETPEPQSNEAKPAENTLSDLLLTSLMRGDAISREQVLTIPSVESNLDYISNCLAVMPIRLYRRLDGGKVEEVLDDERTALLNFDTGDTLDGFQLKKALVNDYFLGKGGYCYIQKYRNTVRGLYYVSEEYVVINYNYKPIFKSYQIFVEDGIYKPYEFIKLLRNTTNGAEGVSIVDELRTALETAYQTQLYQLGLVKTGGNKRGFLRAERKLGQDEIDALKRAWRNLYANNTESVVVLNNGIDFKEAANTSVEMQLNESIKSLGVQIDKIFHISNDFNETFKNAIYPIVKAFETALNTTLLLEREKGKLFFEFDVKEIIKASPKDRYEVYRMSKECQMTTINERRRMENMNEIEGGDVIDLGLGSVLYDVKTHKYYTPNTDTETDLSAAEKEQPTPADVQTIEEESIIDQDNDSEREVRFNPNHGADGKFTSGGGGGGSGKSSGGKSKGGGGGSSSKGSNGADDQNKPDGENGETGTSGDQKNAENEKLVDRETEKVKSRLSNNVKPFQKEAETNIEKVKERGGVNDEDARKCASIAESVYNAAASKEPEITRDIVSATDEAGGQMYGLDFRLKQPTSMAGKIASDSKDDNISYDKAGANINDAIRYTAVIDADNFTQGYNDIKSNLESKGYTEVRCKNFYEMYENGTSCQKAIQCVYTDKSGQPFELQFHTPQSQGAKELNHPLYEEARAKTTSPERAKALDAQMRGYGAVVKNPDGVMNIKSHK